MTDAEDFYNKYYSSLKGCLITEATAKPNPEDPGDPWPTLKAYHPIRKEWYKIEVSRDPEGNGPGFLFGLPHPNQDEQP